MQRPLNRLARALATATNTTAPTVSLPLRRPFSTSTSSPSSSASSSSSSSSSPSAPTPSSQTGAGTKLYYPPARQIADHLETLLAPIGCALDEGRAIRAVTHKSAAGRKGLQSSSSAEGDQGASGSGEKMAFVGRRVLRLHLSLYLTSSLAHTPAVLSQYLSQDSLDALLETKELGAGGSVGKAWGLENVMRWREVRAQNGEPSGLFKSRGAAVESIVGAVYFQHGIAATSKLFTNLFLPSLSLPGSLANALDAVGRDARLPIDDRSAPVEEPRM